MGRPRRQAVKSYAADVVSDVPAEADTEVVPDRANRRPKRSRKTETHDEDYTPDANALAHEESEENPCAEESPPSERGHSEPENDSQPAKKAASQGQAARRKKESQGPGKLQRSDRTGVTKRFGHKGHGKGGKEENLTNLVGVHVSLDHALMLRSRWIVELLGPVPSLITYTLLTAVSARPCAITYSRQREAMVTDISSIRSYLPENRNLMVQFSMAGVSKHSSMQPSDVNCQETTKSLTMHTGLLNRTVSWLPTSGQDQYIAVGGSCDHSASTTIFSLKAGQSCLQIWRYGTAGNRQSSYLAIVYVHDFGDAWELKWCPASAYSNASDKVLGTIAGVFGDGTIRVWTVSRLKSDSTKTEYRRLTEPALTLSVPESPCSAFDWLSEGRLAAGCMNGMCVIWNISGDSAQVISVSHPHTTTITKLLSCSPTAKDAILTTSWDCDVKMSNIWHPETEYVIAPRERMPTGYAAAWSEFLNAAIVSQDLNSVRLVSMRGGFATHLAPTLGTVTALATGTSHPFLAVGDASGCVAILNICRIALDKKRPQFRRRVFQLDYGTKDNTYRFAENYKVDGVLGKMSLNKFASMCIFPEQITINSLAWNTNRGFEGLLASCTTSFLRIDDMLCDG